MKKYYCSPIVSEFSAHLSVRKINGGFRAVLEMGGKTDFLEELYGE